MTSLGSFINVIMVRKIGGIVVLIGVLMNIIANILYLKKKKSVVGLKFQIVGGK